MRVLLYILAELRMFLRAFASVTPDYKDHSVEQLRIDLARLKVELGAMQVAGCTYGVFIRTDEYERTQQNNCIEVYAVIVTACGKKLRFSTELYFSPSGAYLSDGYTKAREELVTRAISKVEEYLADKLLVGVIARRHDQCSPLFNWPNPVT